jgi:hypothetical protein
MPVAAAACPLLLLMPLMMLLMMLLLVLLLLLPNGCISCSPVQQQPRRQVPLCATE